MPAAARKIEDLTVAERALLDDIKRVSTDIAAHEGTITGLVAERHQLFVRAADVGIEQTTIARVAGVSGPAVAQALRARRPAEAGS